MADDKITVSNTAKNTTLQIKVPEWCLEFYAKLPTAEEIAATVKHLAENPDVLAVENAVDHAALSLIARTEEGARYFEDAAIHFLSTRSAETIKRITEESGRLYDDVKASIVKALGSKKNQPEEQDNVTTDKRTNPNG
jgi:hypothetical protein